MGLWGFAISLIKLMSPAYYDHVIVKPETFGRLRDRFLYGSIEDIPSPEELRQDLGDIVREHYAPVVDHRSYLASYDLEADRFRGDIQEHYRKVLARFLVRPGSHCESYEGRRKPLQANALSELTIYHRLYSDGIVHSGA